MASSPVGVAACDAPIHDAHDSALHSMLETRLLMTAPAPQASCWYEEAFRSDYRCVYAYCDLDAARNEVRFLIQMGVRGCVLDLCCGFGRHSLAMAEQGLDVVGFDFSEELLREGLEL